MKTHQNQSVNKSRAKCWLHRRRPGQLTKRPDYVPHQSPSTMITLWRSTPLRTQHSRVAQVFKTPFSLQPSALRLQTPSATPNPIEHPQSRMSFYYKRKDKQQNGANIVKVSACCRCCFCSRCCSFTGFCCSRQSTGMGRMPPQPAGFSIITMAVAVAVVMMMPVHWCTDFAWLPASNLRCRAFFVHWAKAEMFI